MKSDINEFFSQAEKGREYWLELKKRVEIDENWYLIILPEKNRKMNELAIMHLDEFLEKKYTRNAVIIYSHEIDEKLPENSQNYIVFEKIDEIKMNEIVAFYRLQQFFKNTVLVSLEMPFASDGLIGHLNITLEDYIKNAFYV